MKKIEKMNELAWVLGIVLCALGVALCTKANFGLSMVAAPAYILHRKISEFLPWYTQGVSEYVWQFLWLILTCLIVRRFKFRYLLSFGTGILFGLTLDGWLLLLGGGGTYESFAVRVIAFAFGLSITALAIALFFRTSLPLEIYELTVAEVSARYNLPVGRVKFAYDAMMLVISLALAFFLMRDFVGIGIGTVVATLLNATLINAFGKLLDRFFNFDARFPKLVEKL